MRLARAATLALLAVTALASDASALATYYVRPGGSDSNAGTSYSTAWRTITKANSTVDAAAEDVVVLVHGSPRGAPYNDDLGPAQYSDPPNPANAAGGGFRYYFYGDIASHGPGVGASLGNAGQDVNFIKQNMSVRGFYVNGTLRMTEACDRDSFSDLTVNDSFQCEGCDYNVFERITGGGDWFLVGNTDSTLGRAKSNVFRDLDLYNLNISGGQDNMLVCHADSNTFDHCRIGVTQTGPNQGITAVYHAIGVYSSRFNTFTGNRYSVNNVSGAGRKAWYIRDRSIGNTFRADSLFMRGDPMSYGFSNSGAASGTTSGNTWDSMYVYSPRTDADFMFQDGMREATVKKSVYVSSTGAFWTYGVRGSCLVDHNTFASYGCSPDRGVAYLGTENIGGDPRLWIGTLTFTNNILYSFRNDSVTATNPDPVGGVQDSKWSAMFVNTAAIDSIRDSKADTCTVNCWGSKLVSNWNLHSYYGTASTYGSGNRAIRWQRTNGNVEASRPGNSTLWETRYRQDSASVYGSPQFADSTLEDFDPTPLLGSAAIGAGQSGTTIGAIPVTTQPAALLSPLGFTFDGIADSAEVKYLVITNIGNADLVVDSLSSPSGRLVVTPPSAYPVTIAAAATGIWTFTFVGPSGNGMIYVTAYTNDPAAPTQIIECRVLGSSSGGTSELEP